MDFNRTSSIEADDMPKYPARVLFTHVAIKGLQVGSIFSLLVMTPAYSFLRKKSIVQAWQRAMPIGTSIGLVATLGALYAAHYGGRLDIDGVDDRAYRIKHNQGQNRVDSASAIGAAGCIVAAVLTSPISNVIPAGCTGVALGVAYVISAPKVIETVNSLSQSK